MWVSTIKTMRMLRTTLAVDWRYGLRSVLEPKREPEPQAVQAQGSQQTQAPSDSDDIGRALLGVLLQGALGSKQSSSAPQQPAAPGAAEAAAPDNAIVEAGVPIMNAFALEIDMTARSLSANVPQHLETC